jgi:hypothetical protein
MFCAKPTSAESLWGGTNSCEKVSDYIDFCPDSASWKRTFAEPGQTAQFVSSYQIEAGVVFSAKIISEKFESEVQMSATDARKAVIANVSEIAAGSGAKLEFLVDEQRSVFGLPSTLLVYAVDLDGVPVLFVNSVVVGRYQVSQLITWRLGASLRQEDYDVHSDFLNNLRVMN